LVRLPDEAPFGPPPSPELLAWTGDSPELLQAELALQLPGWRLVDWRDESKMTLEAEVLGKDSALVSRLDHPVRRATLMRRVDVPEGGRARLKLRVGREPKRAWRLEIRIDGEAVFDEDVS